MNLRQFWHSALLLVLAATGTALAQPRREQPLAPRRMPRPEIDVISVRSNTPDSSRVDVYFAVPYSLLDFLYATEKYVADYGAIVQITDSATDKLVADRYQGYSVVEDPSHHDARMRRGLEMADAEQLSLNLRPGTYEVRLLVRDLSSHHEFDTTLIAHIRNYGSGVASLSDPLIYRQKTGQRILPAIGGDVGTVQPASSGVFGLAYNLLDTSLMTYVVVTPVGSDDPQLMGIGHVSVRSGAGPSPIFAPMDFSELWMGAYDLRLYLLPELFDSEDARVTSATRERLERMAIAYADRTIHVSVLHGVPIAQADLDDAIEQLQIIATPGEWDSLEIAQTSIEKRQAILDFWRKRDPEPYQPGNRPMEVFYERIQRANAEFGYGGTPGWKTDRGRVFVMLGEPDYIDQHPYEANQKPYEIWQYSRLGTRFYFVDQYLLGEYRLAGPPPVRGTFNWDPR